MQCKYIGNFIRIFVLVLILSQHVLALSDSTNKIRINLNAAFILSRSFSNYPLRKSGDAESATTYRAVDTAQKYRPGFLLGADMLLRPKEKFKIVLGISFSQTSAEYHSSYISEGQTSKPGFTKLTRASENNYKLKFSSLNFHAGIRNQLVKHIFLTSSFILNNPLKIVREFNGYTENIYSNNSGAEERDVIYIFNEVTTLKQKPANLSFRLNLEYQFGLGRSLGRVFIFRNFGMLYALPWWGMGLSYTIRG